MTDRNEGMDSSNKRIYTLLRAALPTVLLAGALAVAGCGGGGGKEAAKAPAPVTQGTSSSGDLVSADGTEGLVGPAGRATAKSQQFDDQAGKISAKANHKTKAQQHGVGAGDACNDGALEPSDANIDQLNAAILCLVNGERIDNSLPVLNHDSRLDQSATGMCKRMVAEQFFSHETPDGKTVVDRVEPTGYIPNSGDWVVGENLAWGSGALSTPQAIVNGWMNSPGHRANILANDYKDIGLAACNGSPQAGHTGGTVYVNNFGARSGADVNKVLPGHGDEPAQTATTSTDSNADSGTTGTPATATVAGKRTAAKRRSACVSRAKKIKNSKKRKAATKHCRKHR
jgi:uncharacterized protein YkwD